MMISGQNLGATPAPPAAPAGHAPAPLQGAPTPSADMQAATRAGFAAMLRQNQANAAQATAVRTAPPAAATSARSASPSAPAPAPAEAQPPAAEAEAPPAESPDAKAAAPGANKGPKPKARTADKAPAAHAENKPSPAEPTAGTPATPQPGTDATKLDPALAQWLAGLNLQAAPAKAAPAAGTDNADAPSDEGAAQTGANGKSKGMDAQAAARDAGDARRGLQAGADTKADAGAFAAALGEQTARPAKAEAHAAGDGVTALALPAGSTFQPAAGSVSQAPAPVAVAVPAPVDSPEFPQALGVQVSLLAQGGVQEAELHLNPAELGPVSVHIAMDGNQARVEFGADMAATRHAIEASLPELASALRDAGLTLAGGGVSQQSRGRGDGSPSGGNGRDGSGGTGQRAAAGVGGVSGATGSAATGAVRRMIPAGGVDLYA